MNPSAYIPPRSLYIHVPLCRSKCAYCDFYSRPSAELSAAGIESLIGAILGRAGELARRFGASGFDTVYIGGGTPSTLPRPSLARLLDGLAELARGPEEWTIEANPESLDAEFLRIVEGEGLNRISLGIQSLDDELLGLLGRPSRAAENLRALELAAASGLALSADLIAGLPRRGGLAAEAETLLGFGIGHLSVYDLVLEDGTPLEGLARRGALTLLEEDAAAEERAALESLLESRGFRRYEVSNYARPGLESLHNLAYWRMDSYIGAGPGAVSTLVESPDPAAPPGRGSGAVSTLAVSPDPAAPSGRGPGAVSTLVVSPDPAAPPGRVLRGASLRIEEAHSLELYTGGRAAEAAHEEAIPPRDSAFETIMMAMRTRFGLERAAFRSRFGLGVEELIGKSLGSWRERLVEGEAWPEPRSKGGGTGAEKPKGEGRLALDGKGLDILNRFLVDCLEELEPNSPASGKLS